MIYGYARCSTNEINQDIERQTGELKAMGATEIYFEYESCMKHDRPELAKLMRHIQPGDTLIATEISRITRSTKQLCEIIDFALDRHIKLIIGSFVVNCVDADGLDAMTEGMIKMMGVFAEMERNMIVERIRSGITHAKAKGSKLGRPKLTVNNIPKKVIEYLPLYEKKSISKRDFARLCGVSRPTLDRYFSLLEQKS
jgi:DNA invertase Pin-like site-specific DNA recombinase